MSEEKKRHGCLTAWLILMLIANSGSALMYLLGGNTIKAVYPDAPGWTFPVLIVACLFNLACTIAIFKWKKWGFWGFCGSSIVALGINLTIGLGIAQSLGGLVGMLIFFGVLQIGKENKGWSQLD
ncbi:hypothetical protein ACFLS1_12640 [Verrucomicrobiota bacterium]